MAFASGIPGPMMNNKFEQILKYKKTIRFSIKRENCEYFFQPKIEVEYKMLSSSFRKRVENRLRNAVPNSAGTERMARFDSDCVCAGQEGQAHLYQCVSDKEEYSNCWQYGWHQSLDGYQSSRVLQQNPSSPGGGTETFFNSSLYIL